MPWEDSLRILLDRAVRRLGLDKLSLPYERGFSAEYRSLVSPRLAMRDVFRLEAIARGGRDSADLRRSGDGDALFHIKVYGARERGLDQGCSTLFTVRDMRG